MSVSNFQFRRPLLMDVNFHRNEGISVKEKVDPVLHLLHQVYKIEGKDNEAVVELTLQINKQEDKLIERAPYWLEVKYGAMFEWKDGDDEKLIQNYLNINAPAMLLSYIRPVVAQLTSASPFGTYHVPFINMAELLGKKDDE